MERVNKLISYLRASPGSVPKGAFRGKTAGYVVCRCRKNTLASKHFCSWNKLSVALLSAVFFACLLSGCSNNPGTSATSTPSATAEVSKPTEGGTLNIPMPKELSSLDPLTIQYKMAQDVYSLVYENLLEIGDDGTIEPSIAEAWRYNEQTAAWELTIRKGVTWHGTSDQVNAYDVEYTLDQIFNGNTSYTQQLTQNIKSFKVLDLYRIEIQPVTKGLMTLYSLRFPVIPKNYTNLSLTSGVSPKGSGPYKVSQYSSENGRQVLHLNVNDKWWKKKAYIPAINCIGVNDEEDAMNLFNEKGLDMMRISSDFSSSFISVGDHISSSFMVSDYVMLVPNMKNPILSQLNVRKAIMSGIDTRRIIAQCYNDSGISGSVPILPGTWLYADDKTSYDFDQDLSRQILDSDGWKLNKDGICEKGGTKLSFKLLVNSGDTGQISACTILSKSLKDIGVEITIDAQPWSEYNKRVGNGDFDMVYAGVNVGLSPDISGLFTALPISKSGYDFSAENKIMDQLKTIADEDTFAPAYQKLQSALLDNLPVMGLFFKCDTVISSPNIGGDMVFREYNAYAAIDKLYMKQS